jgi:ferredoxin-NADP reductase
MAVIHAVRSRLLGTRLVAEGTLECRFERPPGFDFKPGQTLDLTIAHPSETDSEGDTRTYSIASPPYAGELMICTRLRDTAFKRTLAAARPGLELRIEGPAGSFTLHRKAERPAVFLAGGIGITPFMSMLRQADHDREPRTLTLIYSCRRPEETPYLDELRSLERGGRIRFRFVPTMTGEIQSTLSWKGETERISPALIERHVPKGDSPIYYVAGPPGLVSSMKDSLAKAGADEDDIRSEDFLGY